MNTNILVALKNILDTPINDIGCIYTESNNRANSQGDALEYYIKDIFCNSLDVKDFHEKDKLYSEYLSYIGNSKNPPDFIIKNSDAVEVKKIEKLSFPKLALNSSYPKDKLHVESTLLTDACKQCEDCNGGWEEKDMLYVIGNINNKKVRVLWLLYGDCYAAAYKTYDKIKNKIKEGIMEIPHVEFAETTELGKVKNVDPLGVTDLRIRGMWSIEHPHKVFDYLVKDYDKNINFQVYALMLKNKYDLFPDEDKKALIPYIESGMLQSQDVEIKDPNNPAKWLEGKFFKISFT